MESVHVKAAEEHPKARIVTARGITVHNIEAHFPSNEARENKNKEITQTLYRVFSKYN